MLTIQELHELARASVTSDEAHRTAMLAELGDPPADEVVASALEHLDSDDRNTRVAMLRVLAWYQRPDAASGIDRALRDPVRRVREVAVKSARLFLDQPTVSSTLQTLARSDPSPRVRVWALNALAGQAGLSYGPQVLAGLPYGPRALAGLGDAEALRELAQADELRPRVLFAAVRAGDLTDDVRSLLEEIVRIGTKEEAVSATRALCGYRVARLEEFPPSEQATIKATCDPAGGRVFYWVPRTPT